MTRVQGAVSARDHDPCVMKACVPSETLPMLPTESNTTEQQDNPWVAVDETATPATHGQSDRTGDQDADVDYPELDGLLPGGAS